MASNPPLMLGLVLGFPLVFVLAWFLLRLVAGRWADDPVDDGAAAPWRPGLEDDAPGREHAGSTPSSAPSRDAGLDRPEGTG